MKSLIYLIFSFSYLANIYSQNIIINGDFELGTNGLCDCASSFNCFNDAGRVIDGVHPVFAAGNQGCQSGATNYANSLGAHSGTSSIYFYAGLDKISSSTINFINDTIVDLCIWYAGPQGTGASGQNSTNAHFSFGIDGAQIGPDVQVPTNTGWTQFCYTATVLAGNHTFDILSGGAAQYSIWIDDFSAILPCSNSFSLGADTTICSYDTINIDASISGSSYLWNDGSTNSSINTDSAGIYFVEITNNCGVFTDTIEVMIDSIASPIIYTPDLWYCLGDNITTMVSLGGDYWYDDNLLQNQISNDSFYVAYEFLGTTTYYVVQESINGCISSPDSINVTFENCTYNCQSNLLSNGNFEEYSICPNAQNQFNNVLNWEKINGTPDYLNNCGFTNYNQSIYTPLSSSINGYLETPNGDGYAHLMVNNQLGQTDECFGQQINLKKCVGYNIQFRMAHNQFHGQPNYDIGIYGSNTNSPSSNLYPEFELLATINSDSIRLNWDLFNVSFSPSNNYTYLLFAGIYPGSPDVTGEKSIFIDDVFLCEDTCEYAPEDPVAFTLESDICNLSNGTATVDFTVNCFMNHSFEWTESISGAIVSTDSIATSLSPGLYNVSISDENGCQIASSVSVPVPPPSPSATVTPVSLCGQEVAFSSVLNMQDYTLDSVLWNIPNVISTNQNTFTHYFPNASNYNGILTLYTDSICVFDFPFNFQVTESISLDQLNIPNVITANSDGINDILQISPLFQNCSKFELLIHNRWGQLLFKSTSSDNFFSGNDFEGNPLKEGVYFYYLKTEIGDKQGTISVIK